VGTFTDMPQAIGTAPLTREAHDLLVSKHAGQRQKVNGRPYIEHPIAVASDVSQAGFGPELVAAALLHDIVEDSDTTVSELQDRFGGTVAALVEAMTDTAEVEPYERRKALHRERIVAAGPDAAAIFAADKLNNVRALRSAYAEEGEAVAKRFVQPLDIKVRVWMADTEMLRGFADSVSYVEVLEAEVKSLQGDRPIRRR
jgi:(p)ppGpp synthase/HD superfamily hydrolase